MFKFGLENLLSDKNLQKKLKGKRVALMAQPASVDQKLTHSIELLTSIKGIRVTALFGPQHGIRGEKQDNMIESEDFIDPILKIPVFSLYGESRRVTPKMFEHFDVLLFDLQDVGCRIYTFLTTLFYCIEDLQKYSDKEIWVLDRPNPAGRAVEGLTLKKGFESFVGHVASPMRHGLTLGEAAIWFQDKHAPKAKVHVVKMKGYNPTKNPWPKNVSWINPSPNLPRESGVLVYPGSVMVEGTTLSEARGTTRPLEMVGMPGWDQTKILSYMKKTAPKWMQGCVIRHCYYQPTFHKFQGELVNAIQIHVDHPNYDEKKFSPFRLFSLIFKATREVHPNFELWRKPPYEYVTDRLPIDVISGSEDLRKWCDDSNAKPKHLEDLLNATEKSWEKERKKYLLYR